jgi:hypothetical protein
MPDPGVHGLPSGALRTIGCNCGGEDFIDLPRSFSRKVERFPPYPRFDLVPRTHENALLPEGRPGARA